MWVDVVRTEAQGIWIDGNLLLLSCNIMFLHSQCVRQHFILNIFKHRAKWKEFYSDSHKSATYILQ